jgi:hypothetical protein
VIKSQQKVVGKMLKLLDIQLADRISDPHYLVHSEYFYETKSESDAHSLSNFARNLPTYRRDNGCSLT